MIRDERGIGLIEIVVAMFLLAIIALACVPLFINGIKASAYNARIAAATQLVNDEIEIARTMSPTCDAFQGASGYADRDDDGVDDGRGNHVQLSHDLGDCSDGDNYPRSLRVTVTVVGDNFTRDADTTLATATTYVTLKSGN